MTPEERLIIIACEILGHDVRRYHNGSECKRCGRYLTGKPTLAREFEEKNREMLEKYIRKNFDRDSIFYTALHTRRTGIS